jgi:FMNH2-dependent dimethyl sulfone monooxygenase
LSPNPLFGDNTLKLGVFGFNGQAPANVVLDELYRPSWPGALAIAAQAEAAGFEALVPYARWKHGNSRSRALAGSMDVFDPFVWAGGLGQATSRPAVMATSHTSLMHPVVAAKQSATVDQISGGRFALNVVAGWNQPEFEMFGGELKPHTDRYAQAAEWMDIVRRLWVEQEEFDFEGVHFTIRKGESFPKPLQTPFPPIMNAGGSDAGRAFAAKYADLCFTLIKSDEPEGARADADAYRDIARSDFGREIQVWTVAYVVQRETQAEADAYHQHILDHADAGATDSMLAMLGAQSKMMSSEAFQAFRGRYIAGAGGFPLVGSAEQIADKVGRISKAGIDGLLLCWIDYEDGLTRWLRDVAPRLEQAGLRGAHPP